MKKYLGIILGISALLINTLMGKIPFLVDTLYYKFVFQAIRVVYDYTIGLLPFPMVYILFIGLVWLIAQVLANIWDQITNDDSVINRIKNTIRSILNPFGWIIFAFYMLWGWNYQRTSFEERMDFDSITADTTVLYEESMVVMENLATLRSRLLLDTVSFTDQNIPDDIETQLRDIQEQLISIWGEPTWGRVRIRELKPQGLLLRISTAGVYIPFVCEGHVDAGLHPLQYPFTMAHEMAHGYGYTDEGVCNFIGFVTCMHSEDDMIRYAGLLGYWRYLLSNLRSEARYSYNQIRRHMPNALRLDLNDIADQMDKFPDIMPKVRNAVYDSYLKSHGVKKGIANYNDIVRLVAQWKVKNPEEATVIKQ